MNNAEIHLNTNMDSFPDSLYYYTTLSTLEKIIKNRTLWLGDYRFMNDEDELVGNVEIVKDKFSQPQFIMEGERDYGSSISRIYTIMDDIISGDLCYPTISQDKKYAQHHNMGHNSRYIFCLSEKPDDKNMWVLYGKKELGCRIKFNIRELNNYFMSARRFGNPFYNPYILCTKVDYTEDDLISQFKIIRDRFWLGPEDPLVAEKAVLYALISHKKCAYQDEAEYRIVCGFSDDEKLKQNDCEPNVSKVYSSEGTYIKPYMQIDKLPIEKVISEILISPFNKSELSEVGLKDFLYHETKTDIAVKKSGIKIR